ncbi:hypothetical protein CMV_001296 [Castanea mollissima]|uniref:Uncharacterized protein n=1 Tax=Castanea mollissima TaxID=60419 RepID=A0A8J4S4Q6_9ROSI|nr:hypothetical protein CMV_001296 [Castanea mollissima]
MALQNDTGETALFLAAANNLHEIFSYLLSFSDIQTLKIRSKSDMDAFHIAAKHAHLDTAQCKRKSHEPFISNQTSNLNSSHFRWPTCRWPPSGNFSASVTTGNRNSTTRCSGGTSISVDTKLPAPHSAIWSLSSAMIPRLSSSTHSPCSECSASSTPPTFPSPMSFGRTSAVA